MVNNHRAWIKLLVLAALGASSFLAASAQNRAVAASAPKAAQNGAARGDMVKKEAAPVDKPPEKVETLEAELKELQDVQTGLVLTLAACGDEPHCVSGVNDQEMANMQERLQKATKQLEQETPERKEGLMQELQTLREEAAKLQASVTKVESEIDETKLEGNWSDQFVFDDFNTAPAVPFPNEKVPLVRFEDVEQALPLE